MTNMDKEYYICSPEHTHGEIVRVFWRPDGNGYTIDLKQAGLYNLNYSKEIPLIKEPHIGNWTKHDDFYIHKNDVHLLGRIMKCVLN